MSKLKNMDITFYQRQLRKLFPTALIEVEFCERHIKWEFKIQPSISEKEHEEAMPEIRKIYGDTLIERYTEETGHHFYIYQRYNSPSVNN